MMDGQELERTTRRDRERDRHRAEILAAAERVFARKGFQESTIEEIAKEAEFAVGTLYNLFKGKDDLCVRVIEGLVKEFMQQFEARVLSLSDAEQAIAALIELRLRHFHEHRAFIRIAMEASLVCRTHPQRGLPSELVEMHDQYMRKVAEIFERGIAQQIFDATEPVYLSLFLDGIMGAFTAFWVRNEPAEPLDWRIAKVQREFIGRLKIRLNDPPPGRGDPGVRDSVPDEDKPVS